MTDHARIEPQAVVAAVEDYIASELDDAARYDNRSPLDESGVWSLHAVAAQVYEMGWEDAERAVAERERRRRSRERGDDKPRQQLTAALDLADRFDPTCGAERTRAFIADLIRILRGEQ